MDRLGDPLTTCPVLMGSEISIDPYKSWRFGSIHNHASRFGNGLVWTQTRTRSEDPEPLLTLVRGTVWSAEWNWGGPIQPEGIKGCLCQQSSAAREGFSVEWTCGLSIWAEEHKWESGSAYPSGVAPQGGYEVAHKCVIDECSGFQSKIYHRGCTRRTLIFIMRTHIHGHHSTCIFEQGTMNSGGCQPQSLRSKILNILWCSRLAQQAISSEDWLMLK